MRKELKNLINIPNKFIKFLALLLFTLIIAFFYSCTPDEEVPVVKYTEDDYMEFDNEFFGMLKDKKVYLTSIGQANDINNFEVLIAQNIKDFNYTSISILDANDIETGSIVLVFVGCSIKGLSESAISLNDEMERANSYINLKNNNKIKIIAFHLGGASRRGSTSDKLIEKIFQNSEYNIFVEGGNDDKFLTDISFNNNISCLQVNNLQFLEEPIKSLLGIEVQ